MIENVEGEVARTDELVLDGAHLELERSRGLEHSAVEQ